jgi:hypothetical protein
MNRLDMPIPVNSHILYSLPALLSQIFPKELFMLNHSSRIHKLEHIQLHSMANLQRISIHLLQRILQVVSWRLCLFLNMPLNSHT